MKAESKKPGLKVNTQKTKIMASGHFMAKRLGKNGNNYGLIFLGSKVTVEVDCSYEMKRWLLLERKAMTNLDSTLKSKDVTLPKRSI